MTRGGARFIRPSIPQVLQIVAESISVEYLARTTRPLYSSLLITRVRCKFVSGSKHVLRNMYLRNYKLIIDTLDTYNRDYPKRKKKVIVTRFV